MVKIGDVCPIFFSPIKYDYSAGSDYIQKFHSSDNIHIQVLATDGDTVSGTLNNLSSGTSSTLSFSTYTHNDSVTMHYKTLTGLDDAVYSVTINGRESEPFHVCSSSEILERTVLIEYSNKDNNSAFDNIFWVGSTQQTFNFRVEGGFKPSGYAPKVSNEQYRTQFQEIEELYAVPYDSYTMTIGDASGVPYWLVRHINRILCLSLFKVNGERFVRSDSSVPELSQVMEDVQLFTATMALEKGDSEIAGVGGQPESATSQTVAFAISDATDGQMLQYSEEDSAFVNVTTVEV